MKSKLISQEQEKTYVLVFDAGDEVTEGLLEFARENDLTASSFKAIGAFERATFGWFNLETEGYEKIPINEQVEVISLIGDVATGSGGEPQVHAHCVVAKRDGMAHGGHLLEAFVRPTLELVLTETPAHLRKTYRKEFGLALIDLDAKE
ncbi:MAG: PPC domain-containing DNA-binding protein [Pyrinomonadaceae bacterium]